jgi:hypothetical protein
VISATAILVFAGCGNSTTITSVSAPEESQSLIRGEVIEVTGVEAQTGREGDLGTVLVEGARSSPVDEALLTVTKASKIIDRRSGTDKTTNLDAVNERQTAEADFKVVSSSPQPWRAEVEELVICP